MRKKIAETLRHPIISSSAFIFFGALLGNILNFFFNLFMTRNLTLSNYGILASLVSLITLFGFASASIIPTVVHFAGSYIARGDYARVRGLFFRIMAFCLVIGLFFVTVFFLFAKQIGNFFKIEDSFLIILVSLTTLFSFLGVVTNGLLQAKLSFKFMAFLNIVGAASKLILGILFVMLGFAVRGAMWAFFASFFVPYVLSFLPLRFLFRKGLSTAAVGIKELLTYGGTSALAMLSLTSFITTDIILVKHFFDPRSAGIYAGLSLVGRVIFFFTAPIGTVMFPLIVQKRSRRENYHSVFRLSLFLVFLPSFLITVFYFLFPRFSLTFFLKQDEYLAAATLLGTFGIFITMYSLIAILTNFYLSVKKTIVSIPLTLGAVAQASLIWFYHDTLSRVISVSLTVSSLLLFALLLYYLKLYVQQK